MENPLQVKRPPVDMLTMQLAAEKERIDPSLITVHRVIQDEIDRRTNRGEPDYLEIDIPRKIKVSKKVLVPLHRNPEFNYVGKLMGPGGSTLRKLQEKLNCRIYVAGRGSSKDVNSEQQLLASGDPRHRHFADDLHVRIEVLGTPSEAFYKMAEALEEIKAHFNPDLDDEISKAQKAEGFNPNESAAGRARGAASTVGFRPTRGRGFAPFGRGMTPGGPARGGAVPPNMGVGPGSFLPLRPQAPAATYSSTQSSYSPYAGLSYPTASDPSNLYAACYSNGSFGLPTQSQAPVNMGMGLTPQQPTMIPGQSMYPGDSTNGGANPATFGAAGKFRPTTPSRGSYRAHPYASGPVIDQMGAVPPTAAGFSAPTLTF